MQAALTYIIMRNWKLRLQKRLESDRVFSLTQLKTNSNFNLRTKIYCFLT